MFLEHSCQLKSKSEFESGTFFRSDATSDDGRNYEEIVGTLLSDGSLSVFECRYPTSEWSKESALAYTQKINGSNFKAAEEEDEEPDAGMDEKPKAGMDEEPKSEMDEDKPSSENDKEDPKAGEDEEEPTAGGDKLPKVQDDEEDEEEPA